MSRATKVLWSQSPAGLEAYRVARAAAQAKADETGFDYGLWANDTFREWTSRMLPMKANRYGHELTCEVVMCSRLERCQVEHGPTAQAGVFR